MSGLRNYAQTAARQRSPRPALHGAEPTLRLLTDFGLDETREISQRILPAEIARFHRNGVGKTFLHDIELGAAGYWLERHRHLDFARQIGIVEFVRVAQALPGHELQIVSAERMALARGEIAE
jgi:hypothetical protein